MPSPNILYLMMDQLRWDALATHGNPDIYTPNLDRLFARGVSFRNAYSPCPVCVPARYMIRTGRLPHTTGVYQNGPPSLVPTQAATMEDRCGAYLPRTMQGLGYRTFGVGKFHTQPWDEALGYDVHLHSEELYGSPDQRKRDAYATFIREQHPAYDFLEGLMGERTEMYYMPQMSAMPAAVTVEGWAAARAAVPARGVVPEAGLGIAWHPPASWCERHRHPRRGACAGWWRRSRVRCVGVGDGSNGTWRTRGIWVAVRFRGESLRG